MSCRVTFLPDGKIVDVPRGTSLVEASIAAGVRLVAPCNGKGSCGKCAVQFKEGEPAPGVSDTRFYGSAELEVGWRLACMHRVESPAVLFAAPATLGKVDFGPSLAEIVLRPAVRKVHVRLPSIRGDFITWEDVRSGADGPLPEAPTVAALRQLGSFAFEPGMELTAVVRRRHAVAVEAGDTRLHCFGLALDLGTTTVAGALMDLGTGEEVARHSVLNRQSVHGSDVMSRLTSVIEDFQVLPVLQRLVTDTVDEIIGKMLGDAGIAPDRVYDVVVVGNSCMHHIFLGLDPRSLAVAPYTALVTDPVETSAAEVGIALPPETPIYLLPNVASFIGGDALAATLAVGLHRADGIRCLVDIGTNGEIVLGSKGRIVACSTPAGPAFEGASISCGMIASEGAINRVTLAETVEFETVGGARPRGLAGSGLIDACAELLRVGILSVAGKYVPAAKLSMLPPGLVRHIDDGNGFLVAKSYGRGIHLTQRDVRELQLAKGVIFAGIEALKIEMGIDNEAIAELDLAGTFGSYVNIGNARSIGLVPALPLDRIRAVGNAALVGAKMCLLSLDARAEAEDLARRIEHVELPLRQDFQDIFMNAMQFPTVLQEGAA